MAAITDLIDQIEDSTLRERILEEVKKLKKQKEYGLVFEKHLPDSTLMYDVPVRKGYKVVKKNDDTKRLLYVKSIVSGDSVQVIELPITKDTLTSDYPSDIALCEYIDTHEEVSIPVNELVVIALFGDSIYPYLKPMDSVCNAPDSELWHTLIEADNYHALQLLAYLYPGMVDCIYIDPPYNKPNSHDWKYNCDYVDGNDQYRNSKWLSMMEERLKIAQKLLNPNDSVLIVTIDELEYHHLACLLEQMFPEAKMQMVSSVTNHAGTSRDAEFSRINEYIFVLRFGTSVIEPLSTNVKRSEKVLWDTLRRHNPKNIRDNQHPNQFYPIYINNATHKIETLGVPLAFGVDRFTAPNIDGCSTVFPVRDDGTEMMWGVKPDELLRRLEKGYVRVGKYTLDAPQQYAIQFLSKGTIKDIENGTATTEGFSEDGSIIASYPGGKLMMPSNQWDIAFHDARDFGLKVLKNTIGESRFDYPKSIYAVHDTVRFFVANKPNALILDFFAGSGTTLHALNLLNKEDGGHRRCIMVTNNEIGEPKEKELRPLGINPGDDEWEKWGIARYVNWPRTKCSIMGVDVNDNPINGEYITSLTEKKNTLRKITQINYLADGASMEQKNSLVIHLNRQKDVKLPALKENVAFLMSENDDYNASILFDVNESEAWFEALDGNSHITNFFIASNNGAKFRRIKTAVSELMGPIEETVPVKMPMKDGFKTNAIYFKLDFLDKDYVALGRQFNEMIPLLWMKAGAKGECPKQDYSESIPEIIITNNFAVLTDESFFADFEEQVNSNDKIEVVYIITDSDAGYREMATSLRVNKTYQLYKDYLDNFRINKSR